MAWVGRLAALAVVLLWGSLASALPEGGVDLHVHLSMKPALSCLFDGEIDGPLTADSWDDRLSSKLSAAALSASGLSVVVVALFAHPVLGGDMRAQVREQIDEVEAFTRANPQWAIARDAAQARGLLESGRRVLVLSLEGAAGVLESEEDLIEFVDGRGIRIVTPLHLVDDRYGGVATLAGTSYLANPLGVAARLFEPRGEVERGARGLTPLGRRLLASLFGRGVWIDLTHASDAALTEMVPIVRAAGQPLLVTHAMLRRHRPIERATSDNLLMEVAASGGIIGLVPTEDAFSRPPAGRRCPPGCAAEACSHGLNAFAAVWADAARLLGPEAVMLGSDYNGGMRHLRPSCGTGSSLDKPAGLWNIGQSAELFDALARLGAPRAPLRASLERFLSAWGRVRPQPEAAGRQGLPPRGVLMGPSFAIEGQGGVAGTGPELGAFFSIDLRLRKDTGISLDAEPVVYLPRARIEGIMVPRDRSTSPSRGDEAPHIELSLAPAGIMAESGVDLVEGEILPLSIARRLSLDQAFSVRVGLLRGRLRATPSALEVAEVHALYVELAADLLGYQMWRHLSSRADLHGVVLAGASAQVGSVLGAPDGFSISFYGGGGADFTLLPSSPGGGVGYLSQMFALGGARIAEQGGRFFQGFEARLLGVREGYGAPRFLRAPHYRGFVGASF